MNVKKNVKTKDKIEFKMNNTMSDIIFAGFAYLSSKFSVQAIVFISIFLFLFTFDMEYLAVLIGGFI